MSFLQERFAPPAESAPVLEFKQPRTRSNKSDLISVSRSPWDAYNKRKEFTEKHQTDFFAIMQGMAQDGYIKTAVSKYVNSIFLRGYKIHTLKPAISKYLRVRLRMISEAMGQHTDNFFHDMARDLVAYANVYVAKVRYKQPTMPRGIKVQGQPLLKGKELKQRDPIAAYELVHPAAMHIVRDAFGNVLRYEQWPMFAKERPNDKKQIRIWQPEEIIHIFIDREDGYPYGTPFLGAVLEDVRMLRSIEDHVSRLSYRFAFPFTQVKVGKAEPGFQASEEDLTYYRDLVKDAPPDATLVTSEKVEFAVVGAQGQALQLDPYLEYFENRTFTGLQVPSVTMGRGDTANRSTADAMTTEMHDQIKHFQNVISRAISDEIYQELLAEGGFNWYSDEKNWAQVLFEEIEVESKIKRENQVLQLLQANAITFKEARIMLGHQPFTQGDWDDTYLTRFLLPQVIVKDTGALEVDEHAKIKKEQHRAGLASAKLNDDMTAAQIDQTKAQTAHTKVQTKQLKDNPPEQTPEGPHQTTTTTHHVTTGGGKRSVKKTVQVKKPVGAPKGHLPAQPGPKAGAKTTSKGTDNKSRPANQHGKRSGPKRKSEAFEAYVSEAIAARKVDFATNVRHFHDTIEELYGDLRAATIEQGKRFITSPDEEPKLAEMLFGLVEQQLGSISKRYLYSAFHEGLQAAGEECNIDVNAVVLWTNEYSALTDFNERTFRRLIGDLSRPALRAIQGADDEAKLEEKINGIFDAAHYRLGFIANTELPQAFWFGYATAAHVAGIELDIVAEADACETCKTRENFEHSASARKRLRSVPTTHPNCECALSPRAGQEDDEEDDD